MMTDDSQTISIFMHPRGMLPTEKQHLALMMSVTSARSCTVGNPVTVSMPAGPERLL